MRQKLRQREAMVTCSYIKSNTVHTELHRLLNPSMTSYDDRVTPGPAEFEAC